MDFTLTDEQRALRDTAGRYLADRYSPARVAAIADGARGSVAGSWPELVRMGWLDPDLGGVERAVLAEQSGYHLHPVPWWSTMALAMPYLRGRGHELAAGGPATLADGVSRPEALTGLNPLNGPDGPDGPVRAAAGPAGWQLTGTVPLVAEAGPAHRLVVLASTPDGPAVFTVTTDLAAGLRITERSTQDGLRPMARVEFAAAPAAPLVEAAGTPAARQVAQAWGGAMLAAEAVGVAARALDLAVDHARTREQFGRPIGAFQAVAHPLADCYVRLELARSLAYRAGWLVETGGDPAGAAVAAAEAVIAGRQAAVEACETAVQTAGGMGVTWEYPLHRWLRRALWLDAFADLGPPPHELVAASLLGEGTPAGNGARGGRPEVSVGGSNPQLGGAHGDHR